MSEQTEFNVEKEFKQGRKLVRINTVKKEKVKIDFPKEYLPIINDEVHLLNINRYLDRFLIYSVIDECIEIYQKVMEEGLMDKGLAKVVGTLLKAMDYLTHERFIDATFTMEHAEELRAILDNCFTSEPIVTFSKDANRPKLIKSPLVNEDDSLFAIDSRLPEDRNRIYMAVLYKKSNNLMDYLQQVGGLLGDVILKPSTEGVSYEEMLEGKTKHQLHTEMIFHMNRVKNTLSWVFNSCSFRSNELMMFDEMDIRSKLGIR